MKYIYLNDTKESKERMIFQSFTYSFNKHLLSKCYLPEAILGTKSLKMNKLQGKEMKYYFYYVSKYTEEFYIQNLI